MLKLKKKKKLSNLWFQPNLDELGWARLNFFQLNHGGKDCKIPLTWSMHIPNGSWHIVNDR